jgi:hypothetical protein
MTLAANETRITTSDVFSFEDWNILSGDRRLAFDLAYNMMDENKIVSYLGDNDDE